MKVINLSDINSVLNKYMSELRNIDVQNDRMRFRQNIIRIGHVEAYEISKFLTYSQKSIQTPLDECLINTYDDEVVVGTVFRAGLPLHQAFLDIFDEAGNAFVSAFRYYTREKLEHFLADVTEDVCGRLGA